MTNAMLGSGLKAATFEKLAAAEKQNMLTTIGFVNAALLAVRVARGGGSNTAPVCSTWVWLSRHTTKRRLWYPLGDPHLPCVQDPLVCNQSVEIMST